MRVLILGAGVLGTTTAWELSRDGHDVTVLDRAPEAAQGASFGNAGLIATGDALAWASPERLRMLPKVWLGLDPAMKIGVPDLDLMRWGLRFLPECTREQWVRNSLNKHRLCTYSQERMRVIREDTGVEYHRGAGGLLYLFRSPQSLEHAFAERQPLIDAGHQMQLLSAEEVVAREPGFAAGQQHLAGAVYCPTDESGDSHQFTQEMVAQCQEQGVVFHFNSEVTQMQVSGQQVEGVLTRSGTLYQADRYVVALGAWSPVLLKTLGVKLPVYPVQGVSATVPVESGHTPPSLGGIDEDCRVAFSRLGDRMRLTTLAAFQGHRLGFSPRRFKALFQTVRELMPQAANFDRPRLWTGLRPMTPEGSPIIGFGPHKNLLYNTGHGHLGWTMACGSARIAADLLAGESPEISMEGLGFR
jgi:D-amino-acid dehydrogenase